MEKQYYAILARDRNLNIENFNYDELYEFEPKESQKMVDMASLTIIYRSTDYKKVYNELKSLKNSASEIKAMVEQTSKRPINKQTYEMCIARITVMNDWETIDFE